MHSSDRGLTPYEGIQNADVLVYIENGHRLEKHSFCSDSAYEIMQQCWSIEVKARPTFMEIRKRLEQRLE